jgi:hypothetical protein
VPVDDRHPQDVLTHRSVAHGHRPGRARGGHTADRGISPWIHSEEHAFVPQARIERTARHARSDHDIQILPRRRGDRVHLPHVDADAAGQRRHVSLKRGASPKGHQRHTMLKRDLNDPRGLVRAPRPDHHVWTGLGVKRLAVTMLSKDVSADADTTLAQQIRERPARRIHARRRRPIHLTRIQHRHRANRLTRSTRHLANVPAHRRPSATAELY